MSQHPNNPRALETDVAVNEITMESLAAQFTGMKRMMISLISILVTVLLSFAGYALNRMGNMESAQHSHEGDRILHRTTQEYDMTRESYQRFDERLNRMEIKLDNIQERITRR